MPFLDGLSSKSMLFRSQVRSHNRVPKEAPNEPTRAAKGARLQYPRSLNSSSATKLRYGKLIKAANIEPTR